jgi:hypothetical protein
MFSCALDVLCICRSFLQVLPVGGRLYTYTPQIIIVLNMTPYRLVSMRNLCGGISQNTGLFISTTVRKSILVFYVVCDLTFLHIYFNYSVS